MNALGHTTQWFFLLILFYFKLKREEDNVSLNSFTMWCWKYYLIPTEVWFDSLQYIPKGIFKQTEGFYWIDLKNAIDIRFAAFWWFKIKMLLQWWSLQSVLWSTCNYYYVISFLTLVNKHSHICLFVIQQKKTEIFKIMSYYARTIGTEIK